MSRLSADNLSKQYKGRRVVAGVSLEIKSGEIVGLLGPNGAGKTTCFYMIVGLVPVDGGSIALDDTDVSSPADAPARAPRRGAICRRSRRCSAT